MAWNIFICFTLLAVCNYGDGFLFRESGEKPANVLQLFKRDAPYDAGPPKTYAALDWMLRFMLPDMIATWKDYNKPIHDVLQKMESYYQNNKHASLSEILAAVLCQVREMKYFGGKSTKTLDDMIQSIDVKPKCSKKEQKEILEKIVKSLSLDSMLNPKIMLDFLQSDLFKVYAKLMNMPDDLVSNIVAYAAILTKHDVVHWKAFDTGKRFLCHLSVTEYPNITSEVIQNTFKKMLSEPTCTDGELKMKWEKLVNSFVGEYKSMILYMTEKAVLEINKWPAFITAVLKSIDWSNVKMVTVNAINTVNREFENIFSNIQKSSNRQWTPSELIKNYLCIMNISDFDSFKPDVYTKWLKNIGNLDLCSKEQANKAVDKLIVAIAKLYAGMVTDLNKTETLDLAIIKHLLRDDQVRLIQYAIKVIGIKKLDVVVGMVWKNLKKYPNEMLNVDYIFKFLSCHVKEDEIDSWDMNKIMGVLSKFGQPLPCIPKGDWLTDIFKILWKLDFEMGFRSYDMLIPYVGNFTTNDLKKILKEIKEVKDIALASFNKVSARSDDWIAYINQNKTLNMSIIATEAICFVSKADFATIPKMLNSLGDIGACTEAERIAKTEEVLKKLTDNQMDDIRKFLIVLGIYTGKVDAVQMVTFVEKIILPKVYDYTLVIEKIIPQALKDLTIAKVMSEITKLLQPIIDCMTCITKAIMWLIFEQPNGPTLLGCMFPDEMKKMDPENGRKQDGDIKERYKIGFDFPFREEPVTNKAELLEKLLEFSRKAETEKEARILKYVTKVGIDYLIENPEELKEYALEKQKRKRIMEMAALVGETSNIVMLMNAKIDKAILEEVKGDVSRKQAKNILKKAMKDMEIKKKTNVEKKEFIKDIPPGLLRKAGATIIDDLYSAETKAELIEKFKTQPKSEDDGADDDDDDDDADDEGEGTNSMAKLALVGKVMQSKPDKSTVSLVMDTSLASLISITRIRIIPKQEVCSLDIDTIHITKPQIQYLVKNCPENVNSLAKTNPKALGKIVTKVPANGITTLDQLIAVAAAACTYESELHFNQGEELMKRFMALKLNPKINGAKMSCVLKHVKTDFALTAKQCQVLGGSILEDIALKRAIFFKNQCLKQLKDKNITFGDMGSMNAYLTVGDINNFSPESILQGAVVLAKYMNDMRVFNAIGKKISELNGFKDPSKLTADQVEQASIFIAAMVDSNKIPTDSINKVYENLAKLNAELEMRKQQCIDEGVKTADECNEMVPAIKKVVDLLLASIPTQSSRRKRSTTSCSCADLMKLKMPAVQVSATEMSTRICATNFDVCMAGLSQITTWTAAHQKVFAAKAIEFWGQPSSWNSTHMSVASAIIPGLSTDQIKTLSSFSKDNAFEVGKQNNWDSGKLTETFLLFVKLQLDDNVSAITSMDLQTLGNIVCGISVDNIKKISKESYINAANEIGSLTIFSEAQYDAWAAKALEQYSANVTAWSMAEIASIGTVINGFSTANLQKLKSEQIQAITLTTINKILPKKIAMLNPEQIGNMTTSQAEKVTPAQKAAMTVEQKNKLNPKLLDYEKPENENNGGPRIGGTSCMKILTPFLLIVSKSLVRF